MSEVSEGSHHHRRILSNDNYSESLRIEPVFETFVCPLTKQVMQDPVTLENGHTFERKAIEEWLTACTDSGRKPVCPVTRQELQSADVNPNVALRKTIGEWNLRNDFTRLKISRRSLSHGCSVTDILGVLKFIQDISQKGMPHKKIIRDVEVMPLIIDMLKNGSRSVRCKALETLRIVSEDDVANKEALAEGDTIRTIVKFLNYDLPQERDEAVELLYELSKSACISEKIGEINGAILILVGLASSNTESKSTVQMAEKTLENLEINEKNVLQMAENGRMQPLLNHFLEGSPETQLSMASYLGEFVLSNDLKVLVAQTAGSSLLKMMKSEDMHTREAALKSLSQISSCESSAKLLIEMGILPLLVKDLFASSNKQLPMRLKEVSAAILADLVASGVDIDSTILNNNHQTLVSEDILHNLLHLVSNTGPAIQCKLLQILVGLTSSPATVPNIVAAIKSSGAIISLIQFIEALQSDIRLACIKLLHNVSSYMSKELSGALCGTAGQMSKLIEIISESNAISEEQAAAIGVLAELPDGDSGLIQSLLHEKTFNVLVLKLLDIRQGKTRGGRFINPYFEGLAKVISKLTYHLEDDPATIEFARENNLAAVFSDLLQANGLDNVQMFSAKALVNLSRQSKHLTHIPEVPEPGFCACFVKKPVIIGLCKLHHGICSMKESFCLLEGKAVDKLVACLDHANEKVVAAALSALCTLMEDGVDIEKGIMALYHAEGIKPIVQLLHRKRADTIQDQAVWAVERILRTEDKDIACEVSSDRNVGTALVDVYRHGDNRTRQIAARALTQINKLPKISITY